MDSNIDYAQFIKTFLSKDKFTGTQMEMWGRLQSNNVRQAIVILGLKARKLKDGRQHNHGATRPNH